MKALAFVVALLCAAPALAQEVIGEVRVHGNHTTPDADVLGLAGLLVGTSVTPSLLADAEKRLRDTGRFSNVEVRKRFRSIDNPNDILVIVLIDEVSGISESDLTPSPMKRFRSLGMWLPVLDYADGYGFTYGARVSFVDVVGRRSRISVPLTWGGERRAGVEVERAFDRGPFTRVEGTVAIARRENPHFEIGDTRRMVHVRAERAITSWLRAGASAGLTNVRFGPEDESHTSTGVDVLVDTRRDPAFPRNAVHAIVGLNHLRFDDHPHATRRTADLRGYVGLVGSSVLALRMVTSQVNQPLPAYEQALLGGTSLLRGYEFGYRIGDNLAAISAEVRVPITSPLNMSRFGVKGFVDWGTVYAHGAKLQDQAFDRGIGGGVFLTATVISMGLDVAWPRGGDSPRWHFGLGVTF
jgi:outer membrane protein assembly factor BamA